MGKHKQDPLGRPLRPLQIAFRDAYLAQPPGEKDPHQAALQAGYKANTAAEQGRRLMQHPRMRYELMLAHPERAREIANIDAAWVLHELASLWEIPLSTLFDEHDHLRPITEIPVEAQKLIAGFEIEEITVYGAGKSKKRTFTRTGKIRLHDRFRVLESIGKHKAVKAFDAPTNAAVDSLAELMQAFTKLLAKPSSMQEIDITPKQRRVT